MKTCKECGKSNNNGTKFCTRKCRKSWELRARADYKSFAKKHFDKHGAPNHIGAVFDYEGNSYSDQ